MPGAGTGAHGLSRARPDGISAGTIGLALAWAGGLAIARLTGATPVVIVLAASVVWFVAGLIAGWIALRPVEVGDVAIPPLSTAGEAVPVRIDVTAPAPVWVEVRAQGLVVASGWACGGYFAGEVAFARRGLIAALDVRVRSAGVIGIVWWRRSVTVEVGDHVVAPRPQHGSARLERPSLETTGEFAGRLGAIAGEIDGVRPWREGDADKSVHWSSSLRSGELVVHDRRHDASRRLIVRARTGTPDPDEEAGRARAAIEQGIRSGAEVLASVDGGEPVAVPDQAAAARWSALVDLGPAPTPERERPRRTPAEPETTGRADARWWAAAATVVALATLNGALGYSALTTVLVIVVTAIAAVVTAPPLVTGAQVSPLIRAVVGAGSLGAFVVVAAGIAPLSGLLSMLRGPLPQVLVILVLLHGFECRDRRTVRVGLGISGVVLLYAAGFRVDGRIGWWLLAWAICFGVAIARLARPTRLPDRPAVVAERATGAAWMPRLAAVGGGLVATVAVLAVVPVPDGPARLTLPTLIADPREVTAPGAIAGPDGEVRDSSDGESDERAPAGQAGGYTGFAQTMDTSVRGELSDEIVMRVRAPQPDFWRGQTFSTFDGRIWHADDDPGVLREGPNIDLRPATGDSADEDSADLDRFVQTYHIERDMPNVLFAAYRPTSAIVDADVWTRPDGALRASTVLPAGSIYTIVSERARVTAEVLHAQGMIGERLSPFGRQVLRRYLTVPESTTAETIALADRLAEGTRSTYEMVRAYELWLAQNVEYDLNAPLPDEGEDAVHDFLFDSRRGFCEQIASALTIMLRTQGVPARVATGYTSGVRDPIAGVFEVRASDAHAWVEVWFPATGWQAFDPTASVPLSGDASTSSVGTQLMTDAGQFVGEHTAAFVLAIAAAMLVAGGVVVTRELVRRRRRGRWGVLQDRFRDLASERGAPEGATNTRRAESWTASDDAEVARFVATQLDRVAFDPSFEDGDEAYDRARQLVGELGASRR